MDKDEFENLPDRVKEIIRAEFKAQSFPDRIWVNADHWIANKPILFEGNYKEYALVETLPVPAKKRTRKKRLTRPCK